MTNALTDCLLSFRLLKVGGLLMVDDMSHPPVFQAMSAFVAALDADNRIEVLHREVRNLRSIRVMLRSTAYCSVLEVYCTMCLFGKRIAGHAHNDV